MLAQDALAVGHQFSDCADVFMRAHQDSSKERDEWKCRAGTAEQALREACCMLRECLPHITGGPPGYLNNRISVWLEHVDPPNPPGSPGAAPVHPAVGRISDQEKIP
jgi:hypothetical protein